jgi:hypothetical protein
MASHTFTRWGEFSAWHELGFPVDTPLSGVARA